MPRRKKEIGYDNIFPKRLQNLLDHQKNMTQGKLAKIIGVDRTTIGKWIAGTSCPDAIALTAIAKTFNVSTDWLLFENAPKKTNPKLASICEYIGLKEQAVEKLHKFNLDPYRASFMSVFLTDFILSSDFDSSFFPIQYLESALNGWEITKNQFDGKEIDSQDFSSSYRYISLMDISSWIEYFKEKNEVKKAELCDHMMIHILELIELHQYRAVKCFESFISNRYKDIDSEITDYNSKLWDKIYDKFADILAPTDDRCYDDLDLTQQDAKEGGINNGKHNETEK